MLLELHEDARAALQDQVREQAQNLAASKMSTGPAVDVPGLGAAAAPPAPAVRYTLARRWLVTADEPGFGTTEEVRKARAMYQNLARHISDAELM